MTTETDVVVVYDSSLLITMHKSRISDTVRAVTEHVPTSNQDDTRMNLVEFKSHVDDSLTKTHSFTTEKQHFLTWIDAVPTESVTEKSCKFVANALVECLTLNWRSSANKLVVLFTDGPPCNLLNNDCCTGSLDLWEIAGEFKEKGIVLCVVGLEPTMTIYEDFYCALARKTNGEYLPLVNAAHALSLVMQHLIQNSHGLAQAFRSLDMSFDIERGSQYKFKYSKSRVSYMLNHCETMDDIREELYSFTRATRQVIDDTTFEVGSPVQSSFMASTPQSINTDHGYHTQQSPLGASMNSFSNSSMSYEEPIFMFSNGRF